MNQKFINIGEKTQKKQPQYETPRSKRFVRRPSQQSERSVDSKKSKNSSRDTKAYVQYPSEILESKNAKIHLGQTNFQQQLANSVMFSKQLTPASNKQTRFGRFRDGNLGQSRQYYHLSSQNTNYQALVAQMQVRNKQIEVMASQLQYLKQTNQQLQQKNLKVQQQKKQSLNSLQQKSKQVQRLQLDIKKFQQQKKMLTKQIQFLQKINYDDKTRSSQSYKQKYLHKQIEQLRAKMQLSKSQVQSNLQQQIKRLLDQNYKKQNINKSLTLAHQTLLKQVQSVKARQRSAVFQTQEYGRLRDKYKMCLQAYKRLKVQYCELQKQLNRSLSNIPQHILNSNSQLSIVLSDSQSQDNLGKQNEIQVKIEKDPNIQLTKKSLSPRNRQDIRLPISPKSSPKAKNTHQIQSFLPKSKPIQQSPIAASPLKFIKKPTLNTFEKGQKCSKNITFFNEAYRLKIGLGKGNDKNQ